MSNSTLKLRPRKEIIFNGDEVQHLPKLLSNNVEVLKASSIWVKGIYSINKQRGLDKLDYICSAILPNGIVVWWDGISRVYINAPGRFQNTFRVNNF